MFNKIWHRALKSVLISVDQWLKKTHFSVMVNRMHNTATDITDIGGKYNLVAFTTCVGSIRPQQKTHFSHRFAQIAPVFVNLCQQVQRGCT
ncbi:MAG: hypothetical protein C5S48_07750 [Candidatus Methanogaster sp.]|nr:MAG: hypothetical protein C5S48_07750 [ANME-2 cluster archaeon]